MHTTIARRKKKKKTEIKVFSVIHTQTGSSSTPTNITKKHLRDWISLNVEGTVKSVEDPKKTRLISQALEKVFSLGSREKHVLDKYNEWTHTRHNIRCYLSSPTSSKPFLCLQERHFFLVSPLHSIHCTCSFPTLDILYVKVSKAILADQQSTSFPSQALGQLTVRVCQWALPRLSAKNVFTFKRVSLRQDGSLVCLFLLLKRIVRIDCILLPMLFPLLSYFLCFKKYRW